MLGLTSSKKAIKYRAWEAEEDAKIEQYRADQQEIRDAIKLQVWIEEGLAEIERINARHAALCIGLSND